MNTGHLNTRQVKVRFSDVSVIQIPTVLDLLSIVLENSEQLSSEFQKLQSGFPILGHHFETPKPDVVVWYSDHG